MVNQHIIERQAFTIPEFCLRNKISLTTYHKLKKVGLAPREMVLGSAIRISLIAEQDWRREREMPTDAEARLLRREREARERKGRKAAEVSAASPKHISHKRKAGR